MSAFGIYFLQGHSHLVLGLCGSGANFTISFTAQTPHIPSGIPPKIEEPLLVRCRMREKRGDSYFVRMQLCSLPAPDSGLWWDAARRPGGKVTRWRREEREAMVGASQIHKPALPGRADAGGGGLHLPI